MTDRRRAALLAMLLLLMLAGGRAFGEDADDEGGGDEGGGDAGGADEGGADEGGADEGAGEESDAPQVPQMPALEELPPLPPLDPLSGRGLTLHPPITAPPPLEVRLGGFVAFDWQPYLRPLDGAVDSMVQLRAAPRVEARFDAVRAVMDLELRHDFVDAGRNRLIIREAFAALRWRGLRIEGGALLPRWGVMDVASPTDNVIAQDFEDLFFPEPLPVPGLLLGYARGPVSMEGILLPAFRPSRFRGASTSRWDISRFLPASQQVPLPFGQSATVQNDYAVFLPEEMDGDAPLARGIEAGARIDLSLPVVDIGVSFLATRDRLPTYTAYNTTNATDEDGDGQPDVLVEGVAHLEVTAHHRRIWVPGIEVAAALGPLILKGEAAFFGTEDPSAAKCLVDDPYVKYAVGAELVLANLPGGIDVAFRGQYNGDVALPPRVAPGPNRFTERLLYPDGGDRGNHDPGCLAVSFPLERDAPIPNDYATGYTASPEQRHPYDHAFFLNVNVALTRALNVDLRGFVDVRGDALMLPRVELLVLDRLRLSLSALLLLHTGEATLFTPYRDNHRLELGVRYDF